MNQQKQTIFTQKRVVYILDEIIGQGTGGNVYKAYRVCNNQKQYVALKVQRYINDTEFQTLEILSQNKNLNHIINIIDLDQYNNQPVIIMDLADGSFHSFWKNSQIVDVQEILSYFIQIVKGTYELHQLSLIHRDLKLENVVYQVVNNQKHLKLCDTGLIRQQNGRKTMTVGTPYYMPPEQINQQIYDEKIDIWALGMILYEMLAKQTMVKGKSIEEILNTILNLSQNFINYQIDQLQINYKQHSNDIKNLLRMMLIRESQKRVNAKVIITELQRILNIFPLQHNQSLEIQDNTLPIKEQIKLEMQKEFEQKYQQEYEKLTEQHKLEMEQSKNDIIEYYQQQLIEQKIQVQKETEENLKALQQKELNLLQEEYNKKILNCNQQQIEELKYQYEEEKQKIIKQIELKYQLIFQQELKNKELDLQKEIDTQIQNQVKKREQFHKMQLQEQLQKYYQEEFEKKSRNLILFSNQLMIVQQNLNSSQNIIKNSLQNLDSNQKLNQSQKQQQFIVDYQKQLQDKLNQLESINQQLSQLVINSNFSENQYSTLIDLNLQRLETIKNNSQELISPNLVESFIQNSNLLLQEIREEEKQKQIQNEKSLLKVQLENSKKEISKLQDLFFKQKEQLKEVNTIIDSLNQKDNESQEQKEILNQQYNSINIEFEILVNSMKLTREEEMKVDKLEKQNKQMVNLADKLNKLELQVSSFKSKVLEQKEKENQMISNNLQSFIETIDEWVQKQDYLNQQEQSSFPQLIKERFQDLNKELEILLEIKNKIFELINDIKQNNKQNQNFYKQFSSIEQEFQISTFKLELISNYYQKEQRKSQFKTKEFLYVQEEKKKIYQIIYQQFESVSKRMNNLQNYFQDLQNRCNDNMQQQHLQKQLVFFINIFDNHKKLTQKIEMQIIDFERSNFNSIDDIKLEECKIIIQINLQSQNLDHLFDSLNEIKKQMTQTEDKYWDSDLKSLVDLLEDLKIQLQNVKLNQREEESYNNLIDSKKDVQNNIQNYLTKYQNNIQQNYMSNQSIKQLLETLVNQQKNTVIMKFNKKFDIKNKWMKEQIMRIKEIQNSVQKYENQKTEEFFATFIQSCKEISSFVENLEIQISDLEQSKNTNQLNQYYYLAQQYQKSINELKSRKYQNQSYFQTINFYAQQNQIIKCLDALFQLYCLYGREKIIIEQEQVNQQNKSLKIESEKQKKIESFNIIQNCFDTLIMKQNEYIKVDMFVDSIKKYFSDQGQNLDFQNIIDFDQKLQLLHNKITDEIQKEQKNINVKNMVKIKGKITQNNSYFKNIQQEFECSVPNYQLVLTQTNQMVNSFEKNQQIQSPDGINKFIL